MLRRPSRPLVALVLASNLAAHGGSYRSPGATIPFTPAPGTTSAGAPGPGTLGGAPTSGAGTGDLTHWSVWWQLNHAPYLALRAKVQATATASGFEGWFLGEGQRAQRASLGPSEAQMKERIVPALLAVLDQDPGVDLASGTLVALAKIGERADGSDGARIEAALVRFLAAPSQELRETAAVALGILASPRAIPTLANLLWDTPAGQKRVGAREVDPRTRAFAAYGLGLVGARAREELERELVVSVLRRALEADDTRSRDLEVACLVALGLVPLATLETPGPVSDERAPPERSRVAQLEYVLAVLRDERRERLARAQCPVTLARLLSGLPEPLRATWRARVAHELIERLGRSGEPNELVQACVLALGALGTNDGADELDAEIRRALANVPKGGELQARAFALVAAAEAGARFGRDAGKGLSETSEFLVRELARGKSGLQPWAALAAGTFAWRVAQQGVTHPSQGVLRQALALALDDEGSHERLGAYALGAGLARSTESAPRLLKLLAKELPEDVRGQVAIALALLGHEAAIEPLRALVAESKYRPELLRQAAIALALLGDKEVPLQLAGMLREARSLASQAALASALGFTGDHRSVEPLLALLADRDVTEKARAFAAIALGNVADKELLPWNTKIGAGINYRAASATLFDPASGAGILDIF
jgi:HEAT repeat protein